LISYRYFHFHYFAVRKLHFLLRARAIVAFPGGYGTIDELFGALTLVQTRKIKPLPIILVGEKYWSKAINVNSLADEGVIDLEDRELFWYAESAEEIWQSILQWYEQSGQSLFV
jgi:predicted Rossmann-fold nucleotide-binding protein